MQPSPTAHHRESLLEQSCNGSFLETTAHLKANFSFPEGPLDQSMSKYERQAREKLEMSRVVDEITRTILQAIDSLLHDRIYAEITRVVNEVLCLREEVTLYSKDGTARQDGINEALKAELRKLRRRVDELSTKSSSLHFQGLVGREKSEKSGEGVEGLVRDVYEFMQKNEASKLFRECEAKLERVEDQLQQSSRTLMERIEQVTKRQRPINDNLRRQLNDALSKEAIAREIKKSLKENIRYLFDELVRSRKDIDELRDQIKKLNERQRELEFSQTLLEHKIA